MIGALDIRVIALCLLFCLSGCARKSPSTVDQSVRAWSKNDSTEASQNAFDAVAASSEAVSELKSLAGDPSEIVRRHALTLLVQGYTLPDFDWFVPGLNDPSPEVRSWSIVGLRKSRDVRALPIFERLLKEDQNPFVRCQCAMGLGEANDRRGDLPLIEAATMDLHPAVRGTAVWMLENIDRAAALPVVIRIYSDDKDGEVRATAARTLAALKANHAIPLLIAGLGDPVADVRAWSAEALGRLSAQVAVPDLILLMSDPDPLVRELTASALGAFADERANGTLLRSLSDLNDRVRFRVATALCSFRGDQVTMALLNTLDDPSVLVVQCAISSLAGRPLTGDQHERIRTVKSKLHYDDLQ